MLCNHKKGETAFGGGSMFPWDNTANLFGTKTSGGFSNNLLPFQSNSKHVYNMRIYDNIYFLSLSRMYYTIYTNM